jgi:hypothetical protein
MVALIALQPEMVLKVLQGHISGGDYGLLRPSRRKLENSLNFNFTETAWKTGVQEPALLLERAAKYRNAQDPNQNLGIIAIARVVGRMRNADGSRPIEVSDWTVLPHAVSLYEVTRLMDPVRAKLLWSSFDGVTRPLSVRLNQELRAILVNVIADYDQLVESKRHQAQRNEPDNTEQILRTAERRDRYATALRMFGLLDWNQATPTRSQEGPPVDFARFEYDLVEQDMLADDSSVVPGWLPIGRSTGGWFEFRDKERRLLIKNINFQHAETRSGGDLIYVRDRPTTVLFVQYKRLTTSKGQMFYDSADRLYKQLGKLISLQGEDETVTNKNLETGDSYRLSNLSGFVKFVETRPLKPNNSELLQGYYVPAPYYEKILETQAASGSLQSRTEFVPDRYIDSQTFIRLVSGGWIGSRSDASKELARKLGAVVRETQTDEVTLAMEIHDSL